MIVKLPIDKIIIPQGLLPRIFGVNEEKVEEYAESIENGAEFPPIKVWQKPNGTYQVIDGVHRISAYRKLEKKYIEAEIIQDIEDDVDFMIWAISENLKHGLPLSREDKREDARRLYIKGVKPEDIALLFKVHISTVYKWIKDIKDEKQEELRQKAIELYNQGYTQQEIAEELGVSQKTISNWLNSLEKIRQSENLLKTSQYEEEPEYEEYEEKPEYEEYEEEEEIDEELGVSKRLIAELDEILQAQQEETEEHQPQQPAPKKQKKEPKTKPSWETLQEITREIEVQFGRIYAVWGLEKLKEVVEELLAGFEEAEEAKKLNPKYRGE